MTDQTCTNQAPVQLKQVPSTSTVISPHQSDRPDSDSDQDADMETDPANAFARPTKEEV